MRTGTLISAALLALGLCACGGGASAPPARGDLPTGPPVAPPTFSTFAISNASGLRMAPLTGDQLAMAVGNDGAVAFASPFIYGVAASNGAVTTFSGSLTRNAFTGGPSTYGRGADGGLYSGWTGQGQSPPLAIREATGTKWTLVPPRCDARCDPVLQAWPVAIVPGPDGATWALTPGGLIRLNPNGTTTGLPLLVTPAYFSDAAAGPDGAFWVVDTAGAIERVPLSGTATAFAVGGRPTRITAGADGALWFLDLTGGVRRITTSGDVTTVVPAPSGGFTAGDAIARGADRAIWFTEAGTNKLGRVAPSGGFNEFAASAAGDSPTGVTTAPDGSLYFLEQNRSGVVVVHAVLGQTQSFGTGV
jgi:hypothetical protein